MPFSEMPEDYRTVPPDSLDTKMLRTLLRLDRIMNAVISVVCGVLLMVLVIWIIGVTPPIVLSLFRGH